MPIRPEDRARYPDHWPELSRVIRHDRAGNRCECSGECGDHAGRCDAPNGQQVYRHLHDRARWRLADDGPPPFGWSPKATRIVLTVAHLDHQPEHNDPANLKAMCQRCHLVYDKAHHAETRARTKAERLGQGSLTFGDS